MEVNETLIDHIAHLSKLSFEGEQKEAIRQDLQRMIAFVDKLSELDTTGVEPLIFMSNEVNRLRDDIPEQSVSHQAFEQSSGNFNVS